jgi:hypothetical protein
VAKQILNYIYMFYNIIENFVELFLSSVSCIFYNTTFKVWPHIRKKKKCNVQNKTNKLFFIFNYFLIFN